MVRRARRVAALLVTLLLTAGAAVMGTQWWLNAMLQPVNVEAADPVLLEVPVGASTRTVADLLFTKDLIKDPVFFRYYARYAALDGQLKPGEFELSAAMSLPDLLEKLARGEIVTHRVTVREGLTVEETADLLAQRGLVDRDRFLQVAGSAALVSAYLPGETASIEHPLEGYLFPDTYAYGSGVTEEELLTQMLARFERVWTPELRARAEEVGLTLHEVVTLASIIEKEAQVAEERTIISGVFHNRLRVGMKLDADPTVRYALKKPPGEIVLYADLEVDSPYNTYRYVGLPPGPIAAPGEAAIRAALYPDDHDYWFFVAKEDGNGGHFFAATLEEQTRNIQRSRINEGMR